jgi:hypothetical protein
MRPRRRPPLRPRHQQAQCRRGGSIVQLVYVREDVASPGHGSAVTVGDHSTGSDRCRDNDEECDVGPTSTAGDLSIGSDKSWDNDEQCGTDEPNPEQRLQGHSIGSDERRGVDKPSTKQQQHS